MNQNRFIIVITKITSHYIKVPNLINLSNQKRIKISKPYYLINFAMTISIW